MGSSTPVRCLTVAFFWIFLLFPGISSAQTGSIRGTVFDHETGDPITGVEVYLLDTTRGVVTAMNGTFAMIGLPLGRHVIEARFLGFIPERHSIEIVGSDAVEIIFSLRMATLEIQEIVVEQASMISNTVGLQNIPGSAHRLSPRMLEKHRYADVNRVLREVPGINIVEEDGYGLRPSIGMRGTGSERSSKVSLMEDGVLIAPAPYAAPAAYYFPSIGRMQEVEVRKGSSQIKYGPYTTGGALNMISRSIPRSLSGMIHTMAGNDVNRTLHAWAGNSFRNFGFVVETYQARTDGFKQIDNGGDTGFDKKDYLMKLRLNTNPGSRIQQAISFKITHTTETSNETYLGLTDSDFQENPLRRYVGSSRDLMEASHRQLVLRHLIQPARWLQFTTTAYRVSFARNWYKLDKVQAADSPAAVGIADLLSQPELHKAEYDVITGLANGSENVLNVKANNRKYLSKGVQTQADIRFNALGNEQHLEIGFRLHADRMDRFQWVDGYSMIDSEMVIINAGVPGTDSNRIESATATAAYAQQNFVVGRFTFLPGIRFEHVVQRREDYGKSDPGRTGASLKSRSNTVDVLIPGIGMSLRISPAFVMFSGVHKGFAPPGSKDGTRPEKSINYELGSRLNLGVLRADATIFFSDFSNLLGADLAASGGTGSFDQFNGGEVDVKGLEFFSSVNLGGLTGWRLSVPVTLTYTFTSSEFQSEFESSYGPWGTVRKGDQLPYIPRHQMSFGTGVEGRRFDVEMNVSYVGAMRTRAGSGSIPGDLKTDRHIVADVSAGYSLNGHVRLFATARNVTDSVYIVARRPAGLRPGLPRTVLVGLTGTF